MNITRGFNRIFVVLAVVWAFYCLLVYPLHTRSGLIEFDVKQGGACYGSSDSEFRKDCVKMWSDAVEKDSKQWALVNYYKTNWELILPAITIFRAIVYGLCRFIVFVFGWVYRGFNQPA